MKDRYSLVIEHGRCVGVFDNKESIDYVNVDDIVEEMNRLNNQLEYFIGDDDKGLKNYTEFWEEKFEKMEDFDEELLEENRNMGE